MPNLLDELQKLLDQITKGRGNPRALGKSALSIIAKLRTQGMGSAIKLKRGGATVQYVVEQGANGETLTERREGGTAKPIRCPKAIYDAMVKVLSEADRPLPLDEIIAAVGTALHDQPPDFQVRVPLRLWMQVEPPLVMRNRARYRAVDAADFKGKSSQLWSDIIAG